MRLNRAHQGGAAYVANTDLGGDWGNSTVVDNETFAATSGTPGKGGGFYVDFLNPSLATQRIFNSILWYNRTDPGTSQLVSSIEGATNDDVNAVDVTYSDIERDINTTPPPGPWPGNGNILADPEFVSPGNNDYNLMPTSPCLDAGNDPDPGPAGEPGIPPDVLDLDNKPATTITPFDLVKGLRRERDSTGSSNGGNDGGAVLGAINDMGCHERQ